MVAGIKFEVDHYRPASRFPDEEFRYRNLFWSCRGCNGSKSNYWSDPSVRNGEFIPNPCLHRMFEHLKFDAGTVVSKSNAGAAAVRILDLNEPVSVFWRETMLEWVGGWLIEARRFAAGIKELNKRIESAPPTAVQSLVNSRDYLQTEFDPIAAKLSLFGVQYEG